jgi:hypothetical protein
MKEYFESVGQDPDEVDYLQYMVGYSIDGDEYYGEGTEYVSYDEFEEYHTNEDGNTDDAFGWDDWQTDFDDPNMTIDDTTLGVWDQVENDNLPDDQEAWDLYYEYYEFRQPGDPEVWDVVCDDMQLSEQLSWYTQEDCELVEGLFEKPAYGDVDDFDYSAGDEAGGAGGLGGGWGFGGQDDFEAYDPYD